jgi:tRNA A37 threonylcarbamoyltransferase TsaD
MGRLVTKSSNPVALYGSGGNTQVIAFTQGKFHVFFSIVFIVYARYRIFGET